MGGNFCSNILKTLGVGLFFSGSDGYTFLVGWVFTIWQLRGRRISQVTEHGEHEATHDSGTTLPPLRLSFLRLPAAESATNHERLFFFFCFVSSRFISYFYSLLHHGFLFYIFFHLLFLISNRTSYEDRDRSRPLEARTSTIFGCACGCCPHS